MATVSYYVVYFVVVCVTVFMYWFIRGGNNFLTLKFDLLRGDEK